MNRAANNNQVLSLDFLVILLVSLGAAGTSLGLIQANTNNGRGSMLFFHKLFPSYGLKSGKL